LQPSRKPGVGAGNAVKPLSGASIEAALAMVGRLETFPDARALITPFAG
jgi:hypothetical protein